MEPVKPQMGLLWLHGEARLASRWSQPDSVTGLTMEPDKNAGLVCGSMIEHLGLIMEPVWLRLWFHGGARGISLSDFNRSACDGNGSRTEQPTSVLHIPADLHCLLLPWMISAMKDPMAFEPWGCVSAIDQFSQNNFFRLESNHVHGANPCHLVLCFHRFVDVLSLCHPVRDDLHSVLCRLLRFQQVIVQFPG